ncbi:hypothetical protein EYF80_053411 [Liparis tanakae]|uniref:Uncharacterized protein n=1 Tax=Liparis tanakae TaxID=230148 RepID=A0A4Z2F5K4_9TELE|nr:hypothetical protein EYF80_053411 [Liparis tanakae]
MDRRRVEGRGAAAHACGVTLRHVCTWQSGFCVDGETADWQLHLGMCTMLLHQKLLHQKLLHQKLLHQKLLHQKLLHQKLL